MEVGSPTGAQGSTLTTTTAGVQATGTPPTHFATSDVGMARVQSSPPPGAAAYYDPRIDDCAEARYYSPYPTARPPLRPERMRRSQRSCA